MSTYVYAYSADKQITTLTKQPLSSEARSNRVEIIVVDDHAVEHVNEGTWVLNATDDGIELA